MSSHTPKYLGKAREIEKISSGGGTNEYAIYGPGDGYAEAEQVKVYGAAGAKVDFDGYHAFDGLRDVFLVDDNGKLTITTNKPSTFTPAEELPTQEITVAVKERTLEEYVEIDGEWYEGSDAGMIYMNWRRAEKKGRGNPPQTGTPPSDIEQYTVTLYDPFGGGGSFWAECRGKSGSGDMPEEAISDVMFHFLG